MAVLSMFGATLTLPGIAGMVLTVGMAVDANVIIFERIREELILGKTARTALSVGYANAMSAIVDANITTGIAGLVLWQYGSGPIKGFAVTLVVGIIASLFTAIYVTRTIFELYLRSADRDLPIGISLNRGRA
jgi:preprotein translocase subunit SecD